MPTVPYFNASGVRLPGVTWVLGQNLGWNKDALMKWANREGLAGRDIRGDRSTSNVAATVGTAVHAMIEAHIQGWDPVAAAGSSLLELPESDRAKVHAGFDGFQRWSRNNRITVIGTELYGVDDEYQTGFCLDGLGLEDTSGTDQESSVSLTLLDWKRTKGTYADHFIQVAAYTVFVEKKLREWGMLPPVNSFDVPVRLTGAHVLRVGDGNFKHQFWTRKQLEDGWKVFSWLRALHQVRWTIEGYVK